MPVNIKKGVAEHTLVSELTKGLTQSWGLRRRNKRLFASDAAFCARKAYFTTSASEDEKNEVSAAGSLYMSIGSAVHETIAEALKNRDRLIMAEYRIDDTLLNLGGYIDLVFKWDDRIVLGEIKTCGKLPSAPKPDHYHQLMTYALLTGSKAPYLIYVSRSVADYRQRVQIKTFELKTTKAAVFEIAEKLATTFVAVQEEVFPPIPDHLISDDCRYCPFKSKCKSRPQDSNWEDMLPLVEEVKGKLISEAGERREQFIADLEIEN